MFGQIHLVIARSVPYLTCRSLTVPGDTVLRADSPAHKKDPPITFDDTIADGRDDVVLVHLNHRLVQMCQRLLRAEVWSGSDSRKLSRVTARLIPDKLSSTPIVVAFGRIIVLGADNQSLHEEIITAGGELKDGRFKRIDGVGKIEEVISMHFQKGLRRPSLNSLKLTGQRLASPCSTLFNHAWMFARRI